MLAEFKHLVGNIMPGKKLLARGLTCCFIVIKFFFDYYNNRNILKLGTSKVLPMYNKQTALLSALFKITLFQFLSNK